MSYSTREEVLRAVQLDALKAAKDAALKSRNGSSAAEAIQKLIDSLKYD